MHRLCVPVAAPLFGNRDVPQRGHASCSYRGTMGGGGGSWTTYASIPPLGACPMSASAPNAEEPHALDYLILRPYDITADLDPSEAQKHFAWPVRYQDEHKRPLACTAGTGNQLHDSASMSAGKGTRTGWTGAPFGRYTRGATVYVLHWASSKSPPNRNKMENSLRPTREFSSHVSRFRWWRR